ncbi:hypothetical protein MIFL109517_00005 [Micrococcus flavus]
MRRTVPSISSSRAEKSISPEACWASVKKEASTQPVPSSTERNTTRLPERMGGVWVATRTPATSTRDWVRRDSRSFARVTPRASR